MALVDVTAEEHLIDELRQARGSLRSLAAELVKAEERERRGLASEVHDGIAVALTVTQLRLAALELTVKDQAALEMVADLRDVVSEASSGVRAMINSLSPTILYEFGLAAALRKLSEATTARFGLPIAVSHDGPVEQLPEATAVMLYQVARELVHNVVKHAHATSATIRVEAGPEEVRLVVEDDGVGPPPMVVAGRFAATARFGLFSIRERIEHLGGQFGLERRATGGTAAVAVVPAAWPG
jgi:signal transduction histidine kinase